LDCYIPEDGILESAKGYATVDYSSTIAGSRLDTGHAHYINRTNKTTSKTEINNDF
jgi:hypothetical protein